MKIHEGQTIQYNAMQCNAIQYNTIQYNTMTKRKKKMQCNAMQCNTIQYNTIQWPKEKRRKKTNNGQLSTTQKINDSITQTTLKAESLSFSKIGMWYIYVRFVYLMHGNVHKTLSPGYLE